MRQAGLAWQRECQARMRLHARYACVKQNSEEECGAACLATVARQHGKKVSMPLVRQLVGTGHQGTTLLMLAIAAYRGRRNVAAQVFDNLPGLLARQFRPDGSPRSSAADAPLRHEQLFNLQAWANLCVLSSALGRNLLAFTDSNDIGLQRDFQHAQGRLPSEGEEAAALPARTWLAAMRAQIQLDAALAPAPELPPWPRRAAACRRSGASAGL